MIDMIEIALTKGKTTIVDDIDDDLTEFNWYAHMHYTRKHEDTPGTFYAERAEPPNNGKRNRIRMHRVILERTLGRSLEKGEFVDHINCNSLDNCRSNLRLCTVSENGKNQRKQLKRSSIYKGVCWNKHAQKWQAEIKIDGNQRNLGVFHSEIRAAEAYDRAARRYFGEFAKTNFTQGLNGPVDECVSIKAVV
jgi:hypothetical protein